MNTIEQIDSDLTAALKARHNAAVLTLRGIKTVLANAEIANNRQAVSEETAVKLLRSEVKKRNEAAALYVQGGRSELAEKEIAEIAIIKKYLPAELSEDSIRAAVTQVISDSGAGGPQDTGKVMGLVMAKLAGQADGSVVSKLVKEALV